MADSSTSVRLLQHHLRTAGARIAARDYEAAAEHIEAALAIDPASLAALTLRERIQKGRTAAPPTPATPLAKTEADRPAPPDEVVAAESPGPMRFIPAGVDASSWLDFEQRVQERRYRGLVDTAEKAMALGDAEAATAALEEARDLRPDSSEVTFLLSRIALMPAVHPAILAQRQDTLFHSRAFRAVSLLFVGVTLLIGIDWMRADVPPAAVTAALETGRTPVREAGAAAPVTAAVERVISAARSTAAESPALTGGQASAAGIPAVQAPSVERAAVTAAARPTAPPAAPQPDRFTGEVPDTFYVRPTPSGAIAAREPVAAPPPRGEIGDEYVAPRRPPIATSTPPEVVPSNSPLASVARQPAPVELLGRGRAGSPVPPVTTAPVTAAPPPAAVAPTSAAVATAEVDRQRVRNVVNQYTRAYGALDVNAVKTVWPTVKERELARAFANLSSQTLSLDCDEIDVNGGTARASCSGRTRFVGKVGSQAPREEPRTVTFELRRAGESWVFENTRTER